MDISDDKLYQLLSELDYLSKADMKRAQALAESEHISLYDALRQSDMVSDENLGKLISYSLQMPFIALGQSDIDETALRLVPEDIALAAHVLVFERDDKEIKIATTHPDTTDLFAMLAKKANVERYRVFYATEHDIEDAMRLYRKPLEEAFGELLASKGGTAPTEVPVAKIVDTIIEYAYFSKASDVHMEPTRAASVVRFRIDGVLHEVVRLPKALHSQLVTRVKVLSRLRTDEHFSAQDGRTRVSVKEEDLDVRVSIVPIVGGEKVVLRLLASHSRQFGLTDLGMSESDLERVRKGFQKPYGMVLSTGPTGSGKTTSMYAILKILNSREKNIATIEDPVEYEVEGLNQIQVNPKTNLTFANGLRSILRQDPDIIYVGEIRDEETANIAINSAMTGHLVLSTLHTNNAATALPRLLDMNIEPFLVASSVNTIIAQRLVRKICDRCKVSVELSKTKAGWQGDKKIAAQLERFSDAVFGKYFGSSGSVRVYQGKGCTVCHNTGYQGRLGVFEVLMISPAVESLINTKATAEAITELAVKEGMTTMMDDGMDKVNNGITTVEEILRVTQE